MAVVKADAYGRPPSVARAAIRAGAGWLGVAQFAEAFALRDAGITTRLLTWLSVPGSDFAGAVRRDIDLSASATWTLYAIAAAAREQGRTARVHLKVDTGLGRGGAYHRLARPARPRPAPRGRGRHLRRRDSTHSRSPTLPSTRPCSPSRTRSSRPSRSRRRSASVPRSGTSRTRRRRSSTHRHTPTSCGRDRHLRIVAGPTGGGRLRPATGHDPPGPTRPRQAGSGRAGHQLRPRLPPGGRHVDRAGSLGYADGIPRNATNVGPVRVGDHRTTVAGRVCMDQFVIDLGPQSGCRRRRRDPLRGGLAEPTAQDWADATDTISYEIVSRIGARVPRLWRGGGSQGGAEAEQAAAQPGSGDRARRCWGRCRCRGGDRRRPCRPAPSRAGRARHQGAARDHPGRGPHGPHRGRRRPARRDRPTGARGGCRRGQGPDERRRSCSTPTIVLSHGYCLSLRSWVYQRRALKAPGYRVVAGTTGARPVRPRRPDVVRHRPTRRRPQTGPRRGGPNRPPHPGGPLHGRHVDARPGGAAP